MRILTVADQIGLLKQTIDYQLYDQKVVNLKFTYDYEISEQETALVYNYLLTTLNRMKLQNSKTIDKFGEALLDQVEYITNVVTEAISNLGIKFLASDKHNAKLKP